MNKDFVKERDEALLSLDKDKIMEYSRKYGIPCNYDETTFWAGVHKAIMHLNSATFYQKSYSYSWLVDHGFKPGI